MVYIIETKTLFLKFKFQIYQQSVGFPITGYPDMTLSNLIPMYLYFKTRFRYRVTRHKTLQNKVYVFRNDNMSITRHFELILVIVRPPRLHQL